MKLRSLLKSISKNYKKINVEGICFDSRKTKKNAAFFAIKGNNKSGVNFIEDAISKGASAVIVEQKKIKDHKLFLYCMSNKLKWRDSKKFINDIIPFNNTIILFSIIFVILFL